jgi:succinylarginine dihydrolase
MSEDSATAFQGAVIDELGGDKVQEIAGLLGTDEAGAREVVGTTASALSGEAATVETPQEAPLQGVATLGGFATGGLMAGVLAKAAKPVANAVAKKTGLPPATVARVVEMLIPAVLAVLTKRAAKK